MTEFDGDKPVFVMPDLQGPEGNAIVLLGRAHAAFKEHGSPQTLIDSFNAEAKSDTYEHLLGTIRTFFNVVVPTTTYRMLDEDEEWDR